jgi:hypothetical protein
MNLFWQILIWVAIASVILLVLYYFFSPLGKALAAAFGLLDGLITFATKILTWCGNNPLMCILTVLGSLFTVFVVAPLAAGYYKNARTAAANTIGKEQARNEVIDGICKTSRLQGSLQGCGFKPKTLEEIVEDSKLVAEAVNISETTGVKDGTARLQLETMVERLGTREEWQDHPERYNINDDHFYEEEIRDVTTRVIGEK